MKLYFVTGNRNKVGSFKRMMQPEFQVEWFNPPKEIPELESASVEAVAVDKLEKAFLQFPDVDGFLFVTDCGFYIEQLEGRPGTLIKRETLKLGGSFSAWCDCLDASKPRDAYVQLVIAARDSRGNRIFIEHRTEGCIPKKPLPGNFGYDWDEIFVPKPDLVPDEHRNKSFAQIPTEVKSHLLMDSPIKQFKQRLQEFKK